MAGPGNTHTTQAPSAKGTPGAFVVSLDFELMWGMRDKRDLSGYMDNFLGVRKALPLMLEAFDEHGVKATFATVGLLFFSDKDDMMAALPDLRPSYANTRLSPYTDHFGQVGANEAADPYHFGASLIQRIQQHPAHEIACHTFSHYYCLERGQTEQQFEADLEAAHKAAKAMGVGLKSLVFPRNQFNPSYLAICHRRGITAFRGNEANWLHEARSGDKESLVRRGARLLDTWLDLTGPNCHPWPAKEPGMPVDIPASRFLRPWSPRFRPLDRLRLKRITRAMDHAARTGSIFHLWWHPHNFGAHTERNMAFLHQVLGHFNRLRKKYGMLSLTMGGVADRAGADAR